MIPCPLLSLPCHTSNITFKTTVFINIHDKLSFGLIIEGREKGRVDEMRWRGFEIHAHLHR